MTGFVHARAELHEAEAIERLAAVPLVARVFRRRRLRRPGRLHFAERRVREVLHESAGVVEAEARTTRFVELEHPRAAVTATAHLEAAGRELSRQVRRLHRALQAIARADHLAEVAIGLLIPAAVEIDRLHAAERVVGEVGRTGGVVDVAHAASIEIGDLARAGAHRLAGDVAEAVVVDVAGGAAEAAVAVPDAANAIVIGRQIAQRRIVAADDVAHLRHVPERVVGEHPAVGRVAVVGRGMNGDPSQRIVGARDRRRSRAVVFAARELAADRVPVAERDGAAARGRLGRNDLRQPPADVGELRRQGRVGELRRAHATERVDRRRLIELRRLADRRVAVLHRAQPRRRVVAVVDALGVVAVVGQVELDRRRRAVAVEAVLLDVPGAVLIGEGTAR